MGVFYYFIKVDRGYYIQITQNWSEVVDVVTPRSILANICYSGVKPTFGFPSLLNSHWVESSFKL
jgi:hypothetical protein